MCGADTYMRGRIHEKTPFDIMQSNATHPITTEWEYYKISSSKQAWPGGGGVGGTTSVWVQRRKPSYKPAAIILIGVEKPRIPPSTGQTASSSVLILHQLTLVSRNEKFPTYRKTNNSSCGPQYNGSIWLLIRLYSIKIPLHLKSVFPLSILLHIIGVQLMLTHSSCAVKVTSKKNQQCD